MILASVIRKLTWNEQAEIDRKVQLTVIDMMCFSHAPEPSFNAYIWNADIVSSTWWDKPALIIQYPSSDRTIRIYWNILECSWSYKALQYNALSKLS